MSEQQLFHPPTFQNAPKPHLQTLQQQQELYKQSIEQPAHFWDQMAKQHLHWDQPYKTIFQSDFKEGNFGWFLEGRLNVSYNCIDRHALQTPEKIALIWEQDEPNHAIKITYQQLLKNVCQLSNTLISLGVQKGDSVAIYMPMIPEAVYAMLACARIGAVHSVVFAGFSSEALRDRMNDAGCKILITADEGRRGGKIIHLKKIADEALLETPLILKCLIFKRTGAEVPFCEGRDVWWQEIVYKQRPYCPPVSMHAEDPLFLLYTSGSTGKPKGLLHTQAGYLLNTTVSLKYTFDLHDGDVYCCAADVGWITGHSYIVYGPLSLGVTVVLFESVPTYPQADRYWQMIQQHHVTHFYTAPTAIRALKRLGDQFVSGYEMQSLRVLGTVGEPINPEAWLWYHQTVGRGRCALIDTYWQTETGSFLLAPYATVTPTKPGSATLPQFGILPVILDPQTGQELEDGEVEGVLCLKQSWPSIARGLHQDHDRFISTYFQPYPGYYFTGDGVYRDQDGYYFIRGRVDDVINVSGHRLSTAEIESALVGSEICAEAGVVGMPDELTGQSIVAFCTLKIGTALRSDLEKELILQVRKMIGPFAQPKRVIIVEELPKTRSGKIMRRVLRKICCGEQDGLGDLSTLADPSIIQHLIQKVRQE